MSRPRVLVVGGSGVFGERLAEGLIAEASADVLIGGRSIERAQATANRLGAAGAIALDRLMITAAELRAMDLRLVIDAAGPFQGADLRFARATIAAGVDYIDLADARDFTAAFPQLDDEAKSAGVVAVCGASSSPAVSHAALDSITQDWRRIDSVRVGISPGAQAPRGESVVEAVLSWTGAPVRVWAQRGWRELRGWGRTEIRSLPGLGRRRFALAETADLDLLATRYRPQEEALFLAGLELGVMHRGLSLLSLLRSAGLLGDLRPLASALRWGGNILGPLGSDCGGMFVEAIGRDAEDRPARAEWTLFAPRGVGPYVPTLPALVLSRRLVAGHRTAGARVCVGELSVADLEFDFHRLSITTSGRTDLWPGALEASLGERLEDLPPAVKASHKSGPIFRMRGEADVSGAAGPIGAMAARLFGFPSRSKKAVAQVLKRTTAPGCEIWERKIGGARFRSRLRAVGANQIEERFGPFTFRLRVDLDQAGLVMTIKGWRIGSLPLPAGLAPKSLAREFADETGGFRFDVPIALPLAGRLTHYRGWLLKEPAPLP